MPTYYVRGSGTQVTLTDRNFVAKGGEKSVYALGSMAYCVYHDPKAAIPSEKIQELSVLDRTEIIRPISELLDFKKRHCGETMPFVQDSYAPNDHSIAPLVLCQLFTNSFRRKHGITNDSVRLITDSMLEVVPYCHSKGVILVDPNETNWLVHSSLKSVFLIDTSCCQTASYPGTAIKPAIRDWEAKAFTAESDYFSLAVVLGWLWVGIHPYLAFHPDWAHLDANTAMEPRMRKHCSFFDVKTEFNRACRSLDEIPETLKQWLKAVLHEGKRMAPPKWCSAVAVLVSPLVKPVVQQSSGITITEIDKYADDIAGIFGTAISFKVGEVVGFTPVKSVPVFAVCKQGMLLLNTGTIEVTSGAKAVIESDGRIYAISSDMVSEVVFNESGATIRATVKHVGSIADLPTTKIFSGCVLQNLLGRYLLSVFPESGKCMQHQLSELEGWQVLDAKYERGVFVVMAETGGKYTLLRYRLQNGSKDVSKISDQVGDVNFAVTDKGVCVLITPEGELIACSSKPFATTEKRLQFPSSDMTLFARGPHIVGAVGKVLYRISLS